jgi:hypothetical protein
MINVSPVAEIEIDHPAAHLATAMSGYVLACSREGQCSLVAPNISLMRAFHLSPYANDIALAPAADLVGVAADDGLQILDLITQRLEASFEGSCVGVGFSPDDKFLWSVSRLDSDLMSVEVRDRYTWRMVSQANLQDPFGESIFRVHFHPGGQYVAVWAGSQDGQAIFFARRNGAGIEISRLAAVDDTTPPSFSRTGDQFLILVEDPGEVRLYSFPECCLLGQVCCPEDELSGYYAEFAGDDHALLQWGKGRLLLADLRTYSIVDEVAILGHELRPVPELYPILKSDTGMASDLCFFQAYRQAGFISVHGRRPKLPDNDEKFVVLAWQLPELYKVWHAAR